MHRIRPDVDVIKDVLEAVLHVQNDSVFVNSLLRQYQERGGLSKKQLEGLYSKALKIQSIPPGKLATLEAIILKRPTRYKSRMPEPLAEAAKDPGTGPEILRILEKYPEHKRMLFLKSKYDHGETLSPTEVSEISRIGKMMDARK